MAGLTTVGGDNSNKYLSILLILFKLKVSILCHAAC